MRASLRWCALSTPHESHHTVVVTRLGPSTLLPHLRGVFTTRPLKALTTLTILPRAARTSASSSSSSPGSSVVQAPPYLCNLAAAPRHRISLRRFLALRHQFCSDRFLHVATDAGWYLLAPSDHAALADMNGLQAWLHRAQHTNKEEEEQTAEEADNMSPVRAVLPRSSEDWRRRQLMVGETSERTIHKLAKHKTRDIMDDYLFLHDQGYKKEEEEHELSEEERAQAKQHKQRKRKNTTSSKTYVIPEEHLFEVNDGVPWPLPPHEDLTSVSYWKGHRARMAVYESDGGLTVDDHEAFVLQGQFSLAAEGSEEKLRNGNDGTKDGSVRDMGNDEAALAAREALFQAYTNKANVSLQVNDHTGQLSLTPLVDLPAHTELLLHYGREWWTQRLLAPVLLAVSDAEMHRVRWLEALCAAPSDVSQPFPRLLPVRARRRGKQSSAENAQVLVLANAVTRRRASDAAVLAFAVRRSCSDRAFYTALLRRSENNDAAHVFDVTRPDAEVPMRRLRRALLHWLHAEAIHKTLGTAQAETESAATLSLPAAQDLLTV